MSESNLSKIGAQLGLPSLSERLGAALAQSADPVHAPALALTILEATANGDGRRLAQTWQQRPDAVTRVLACLCGAAPFFVAVLLRHPDWLAALAEEDLAIPRDAAGYAARLEQWCNAPGASDAADRLRCFKYYELARITVRDLSADLVPEERAGETLAELSNLADALLARALSCAAATLQASDGPPRWRGSDGSAVDLGFVVLGLGKLGARELNFSSDVDLVYVHESPSGPVDHGPGGLSPAEYFTRLVHELGRLVGKTTGEGFLYRIDLDLRPEGKVSPLVVSSDSLAGYYELWAATWEKSAFMKARPVAGDTALGWRVIRAIDPMIYRSAMDYAGVAAIKEMKERIEQEKGRTGDTFDVKLGAGGIRDIEFVAQALQMLHGGRIPQVRARSTQRALRLLAEVGVLPGEASQHLLAAYRFLRRTENRLQMQAERQTHRLPPAAAARERIARAMGFLDADPAISFEGRLASHRERVRQIFAAVLPESGSDRVLGLFARNVPHLLEQPTTRALIEELAAQFARQIDVGPDPQRAMNNLDRFIQGVGSRRFYYELLLDRPELVPRLANLFAASEYLSTYFATHPRLIEPVFSDPNVLLLSRQQLQDSFADIHRTVVREQQRDDIEASLDALRLFHNRELLNVGLLDLADKVTPDEVEASLTDIAEVCVELGLSLARAELQKRSADLPPAPRQGEFLVVGMGKLASGELTYGSDLDVIFLYDVPGADDQDLLAAQEYFVRLAQKLIWVLQVRTKEGVCYQIDARLRPSGNQGMLVTSAASFAQYHERSAQVWERQALLRARPVPSGGRLARTFEAMRREILSRPLPPNVGAEIHRIRLRMESERGQETAQRHDFKTGRGGLIDVETIVQFLQLQHGPAHPKLFTPDGIATQLGRLEGYGLLATEDARTLREGWQFLQRLASRLRIVENRSISDLDEERGDLDALARRLGYQAPQRASGARRALLDDYRRHTAGIRALYLKLLHVPDKAGG